MNTLRKSIFYLFALIYIILCPLIILDALGIVIQPGAKRLMMSTGLISISTIPEGASIYINNQLYLRKSPAILRDLSKGEYLIKLELDGYRPWEQTVFTSPQQAITMENILLIPKEWPKQILMNEAFTSLQPVEGLPFFLLSKDKLFSSLRVFQWDENILNLSTPKKFTAKDWDMKPLIEKDSPLGSATIANLFMVPHSPFILLQGEQDGAHVSLWINALKAENQHDLSSFIDFFPESIQWDYRDPDNIFVLNHDSISRVNVADKKIFPRIIESIKGFGIFERRVYVLDQSNRFLQSDYTLDNPRSLMGSMTQLPKEFQREMAHDIYIFSNDHFVLKDKEGHLLTNKLPYVLIDEPIVNFSKELNDKRLLIWTKQKIGIIDFSTTSKEGIFETGPSVTWLIQSGRDIRQVFWVNKGNNLVFLDGDSIWLVETTLTGQPEINFLVKTDSLVSYSERLGKLFYLDRDTHALMSLTILPPHEYVSFNVPETFKRKKNPR
jgi:hypothetical protein